MEFALPLSFFLVLFLKCDPGKVEEDAPAAAVVFKLLVRAEGVLASTSCCYYPLACTVRTAGLYSLTRDSHLGTNAALSKTLAWAYFLVSLPK